MANKAIDKSYLLTSLKELNSIILSSLYQDKETADKWHAVNNVVQEIVLGQNASNQTATFTSLDTNYAYRPFITCADGQSPPSLVDMYYSGTTCVVTVGPVTAAQSGINDDECRLKLRAIKN